MNNEDLSPRKKRQRRIAALIALTILLVMGGVAAYLFVNLPTSSRILRHIMHRDETPREELVTVQHEPCSDAPFLLPSEGWIGLLYADPSGPYSRLNRHQGIDVFSLADPGTVPVYAAYDGYLTREADWKSSLIIRVPDDPLNPGRQIWLYYTHMADESGENDFIDEAFPPGTYDEFVSQGTLLGYTGNYSGNPSTTVWTHLHFSIVLDDGEGHYTNELEFDNTIDPSRYLGMAVNVACAPEVLACTPDPLCGRAILGDGGG